MLGYGFATLREHASTQPTNQGFFQYRQGIVTYYIISNSLYSDIDVYDRYFSLG